MAGPQLTKDVGRTQAATPVAVDPQLLAQCRGE